MEQYLSTDPSTELDMRESVALEAGGGHREALEHLTFPVTVQRATVYVTLEPLHT